MPVKRLGHDAHPHDLVLVAGEDVGVDLRHRRSFREVDNSFMSGMTERHLASLFANVRMLRRGIRLRSGRTEPFSETR
jgi:hypothetical protein